MCLRSVMCYITVVSIESQIHIWKYSCRFQVLCSWISKWMPVCHHTSNTRFEWTRHISRLPLTASEILTGCRARRAGNSGIMIWDLHGCRIRLREPLSICMPGEMSSNLLCTFTRCHIRATLGTSKPFAHLTFGSVQLCFSSVVERHFRLVLSSLSSSIWLSGICDFSLNRNFGTVLKSKAIWSDQFFPSSFS